MRVKVAKHFKEPEIETNSKKKKMSKGRRAFVIVRNLILIGILAVAGLIGYTAFKVGNISQDTLYSNIERSSIVYDKNEKEIDTLHYTEDRTLVRIDEMPDDLKNDPQGAQQEILKELQTLFDDDFIVGVTFPTFTVE